MYRILSCVRDDHSTLFVLLAVSVLSLGAICASIVFDRGRVGQTEAAKRAWAAAAGVVIALGIWGTHFVAMLGYQPGFAIAFDGWTTAISAVIAIAGFVAVYQLLIGGTSLARRMLAALLATSTVSIMHFYGQGALKASALIEYDVAYVVAAVVLCGVFFTAAYGFGMSAARKWTNALGIGLTLLAVASVHFVGTAAMTVFPIRGLADVTWTLAPSDLAAWLVAGIVLIILAGLVAAGFDRFVSGLRFQENRRISMLADSASEGIIILNASGVCIEVNKATEALLGEDRDDLLGRDTCSLIGLSKAPETDIAPYESHIRHSSGMDVPVEVRARKLSGKDTGFTIFAISDLRERLRHESEMRTLAFTDQLSGLANREAFQRELLAVKRDGHSRHVAVILMDLDEFKDVNDQYGHGAGDAVIVETARRLEEVMPPDSLVARLGGDEFAVFTGALTPVSEIEALASEGVKRLSEPVLHDGIAIRSGASAGIFLMDEHLYDGTDVLKAADRALYAAKADGRGRARLYDEELHRANEERRDVEAALALAVEREEFVLYYQPKVSTQSREPLGYEALIRWNRPGHGLVMPNDFIDIAEQSMLINDIGRWCVYEACQAAAGWAENLTVSVNLSARQFLDPKLYGYVRDALRRSGLAPERLELEITETAIIHNMQLAANVLGKFKKLGVKIALDDFGTGYSSMRFVQQLPFDRIKIDKSFVLAMDTDVKSLAIVDAILRLGQSLSIPVVAEGVETEAQANRLRDANCHELQGYLISRPMPITGELKASLEIKKRGAA